MNDRFVNYSYKGVMSILIFVLTRFTCRAGVTGNLMELPTPAADSIPVPQAMETTPPTQPGNKGESPTAGSAPSSAVAASKEKQQVDGASTSNINGTYVYKFVQELKTPMF